MKKMAFLKIRQFGGRVVLAAFFAFLMHASPAFSQKVAYVIVQGSVRKDNKNIDNVDIKVYCNGALIQSMVCKPNGSF